MRLLTTHLAATPLVDGQKVLALSFMHGSRRRLEERLGKISLLRGRTECATIDSFAWHVVGRWLSLAEALGHSNIRANEYERICNAAGALLQVNEICAWVAATFPVVLIDEAQDLTANRLLIIKGLATRLHVFAAADEFQCLNEDLRPNPTCTWLTEVASAEELQVPRRTDIKELLDAATAIRSSLAPKSGKLFKVALTPKPQLAGAWISGNLRWYGGGKSVAIITPALGTFAKAALAWSASNKTTAGAGPYSIPWEESEAQAASNLLTCLALQESNTIPTVVAALASAGDPRALRDIVEWMDIQRRALSKTMFSREELVRAIEQSFARRRRSRGSDESGWRGMTVHGAKNREFDNVVALWPAAITGSDDQKRRLLYNAVTRARERCLVLVQAKASLGKAPYA
jgi:hypothetical protein